MCNNQDMKQSFRIQQSLTLKPQMNQYKKKGLYYLQSDLLHLRELLKQQVETNPYLQYKESDVFLNYDHHEESLYEHVMDQLRLMDVDIDEKFIGLLTSQLDSNGYFRMTFDELLRQMHCEENELNAWLKILRTLDPVGCYAFTLKDSLRAQCEESDLAESETGAVLCEYLPEIADQNFDEIMQETELSYEEIVEGLRFIRTLDPKPARMYSTEAVSLIPEFRVTEKDEGFTIEYLADGMEVFLNDAEATTDELKRLKKEAMESLNCYAQRKATLLMIMSTICDMQADFFRDHSLNYCTLAMIAEKCSVSVSTVSRAIDGKSFEWNGEYFPVADLLSHSGTKEFSLDYILKEIQELIQSENKKHPLSDEQISRQLTAKNIKISRRAVNKYRKMIGIQSSEERKEKDESKH